MSKYFKLEEFLDSSVARQKGISNLPSWDDIERLKQLASVLDDIREAWSRTPEGKGTGIKITSGFRCPKLNEAVGGVKNSIHQIGWAADLQPVNGKFKEFVRFLQNWLPRYERSFDQCIIESSKKSQWVHFGWMNANGGQRRQLFSMTVK